MYFFVCGSFLSVILLYRKSHTRKLCKIFICNVT